MSPAEKIHISVVEKQIQVVAPAPLENAGRDPGTAEKPFPAPPVIALPDWDVTSRLVALREKLLADPVALERVPPGKALVAFDGSPEAPVLFLVPMPGPGRRRPLRRALAGAEGELYGRIVAAMGLPRAKVITTSLLPYPGLKSTAVTTTGNPRRRKSRIFSRISARYSGS